MGRLVMHAMAQVKGNEQNINKNRGGKRKWDCWKE
jgi:hypothetical protein